MRRYSPADEERIRTGALVREWTRSGLLTAAQSAPIEAGLRTDLRRTNLNLRAVLFIFGTIIVWAALGFCLLAFGVSRESLVAWSAVAAGVVCFVLAEVLVFQFRLYRFGVEEAFAVWSVVLLAAGTGYLVSIGGRGYESTMLVALLTGMTVSLAVYLRFGYLYAAFAAAACAASAPFFLGLSEIAARLLSVSILFVIFIVAETLRRPYEEDFPGDDYGAIQSAAWLGIYAVLNLQLSPDVHTHRRELSSAFYWGTYAAIWLLPAAGLYLGIRSKHRGMIWANLIMVLATLVTNKMYLGWEHHTWDPILLGVVLMGVAIAVRRWLSRGPNGQRNGFTPQQVFAGDRRSMAMLGSFAGAAQPFAARIPAATQTPSTFEPGGGGRSGGGGGGGEF
jgi:hypothetical protein